MAALLGPLVVFGSFLGTAPATAADDSSNDCRYVGKILRCGAERPPSKDPGGQDPPGEDPPDRTVDASECLDGRGEVISCRLGSLVWFDYLGCYARQLHPPPGDPMWHGHKNGSVWECDANAAKIRMVPPLVTWVPPSEKPAEPVPDPSVLGQQAVEAIAIPTPKVHSSPPAARSDYVNYPTILWVSADVWRSRSLTVSVRGTSVTGVVTPVRLTWRMGEPAGVSWRATDPDGVPVSGVTDPVLVCDGPGEPWRPGDGQDTVTRCSYTYRVPSYRAPGGRYQVTATVTYHARWTCAGVCLDDRGDLGEVDGPAGVSSLHVGEQESVVVNAR